MTDFTYVVADLHGRADLLSEAGLTMTRHGGAHEAGSRTIVTLGDYIDRGPESKRVLDILMRAPAPGWTMVNLRGNHEQMMLDHFAGRDDWGDWMRNGGDATLASFMDNTKGGTFGQPGGGWGYMKWLARLPLIHSDRHRIYVHADMNPHAPLDRQQDLICLWSRERYGRNVPGKHVVVGHTPDDLNPRTADGRTDLDTQAYETGRLAVAVFNDDVPGPPVDFLDIRGERGVRVIHQDEWMV